MDLLSGREIVIDISLLGDISHMDEDYRGKIAVADGKPWIEVLKQFESDLIDVEVYPDLLHCMIVKVKRKYHERIFQKDGVYFKLNACNARDIFVEDVASLVDRVEAKRMLVLQQRRDAEEMMTPIKIHRKTYKKLMKFPVLYSGWECDGDAWVVENRGERHLVMTSHGSPYLAKPSELRAIF